LINLYHSFYHIDKNFYRLLDLISNFFTQKLNQSVSVKFVGDGASSVLENLKNDNYGSGFVSEYEAIYLEAFYEYIPLIKIGITNLNAFIIVRRYSNFRRIEDLKRKSIGIQTGREFYLYNPIISFFVKNCNVSEDTNKGYFPFMGYQLVTNLIDNYIDAAIILKNIYESLDEEVKKKVKILGEFSTFPGFVFVMNSKVDPDVYKKFTSDSQFIEELRKICYSYQLDLEEVTRTDRSLIIGAIEDHNITFKEFIENFENDIISFFSSESGWELKQLRDRVNNLTRFNEKLVELYKSLKESRDKLTDLLEIPFENIIIFSKDGKITGVSRYFLKNFKYSRRELMKKNIFGVLISDGSLKMEKIINEVDYGLVHSCKAQLKCRDNTFVPVKINFNVIEMDEKKLIIGIVNKM